MRTNRDMIKKNFYLSIKEIELLEKDQALQNTEIEKQITQKYAFIGGFALMLILAIVALLSYRKIKVQK